MWKIEVIRKTKAKKEQIWSIWADVHKWNIWDKEVKTSELFGKFQKGTKGILKPTSGPKAKFEIIELTNLKSFTSRSFLPFCKIDFIHFMNETEEGLEIIHKIEMTGFMSFIFSKVIGSKIKIGLAKAVDKLIEFAEKN